MNIAQSFVSFMEDNGLGTFATDIFIAGVPEEAPTKCWWVIMSGGSVESANQTGEKIKNYILDIYYRNTDTEDVYETMQEFEELLNSGICTQIQNFDTIDVRATLFPTDKDIDGQDRTIGLIQATVKTYK